jgi:hypothetical protein
MSVGDGALDCGDRDARQDVVHQIRCNLGDSASAARGADSASLTAKRHQGIAGAGLAVQSQEAVHKDAALKVGVKFVFDE